MKRLLAAGLTLALFLPGHAPAKDVYKAFLDPAIPHHKAIMELLAKIEAKPDDASLYNDLGCLVAWDGFWRDALRNFEAAAKLDKGDTKPMFNAGLVHAWMGDWGAARSAFGKAVKRGPGNWAAWWMLGYAEEKQGNAASAVDAYKRALRMDTSLFDVRRNPFAASSRLKAVVLTETYEKRLVRAAMPRAEQFEDDERITNLLQPSKVTPRAATAPSTPEPAATGPIVTTVPPAVTVSPRTGVGAPGSPYAAQPVAPRDVAPHPALIAPDAAPRRVPVPGPGGGEPYVPPQTAPVQPPRPPIVPGPGAGA